MLAATFTDLRHAARRLLRSRGFTVVTVLTLALCVGANTAIFSGLYSILLKPMPFPNAERIVDIYNSYPKQGLPKFPSNIVQYLDYRQNGTSYESLGLWGAFRAMVAEDGGSERLPGAFVTADLFDVLQVKPVIGRFFTAENQKPDNSKVVVLTETYWRTEMGEDPGVLGRELRIDQDKYTIIGVAPQAVEALDAQIRLLRPLAWPAAAENPNYRHSSSLWFLGRLKTGTTLGQAQAEADTIEKRFYDSTTPGLRNFIDRSGARLTVGNMRAEKVKPMKTALYLLQGGVLLVLLIGTVNVANLMLARVNGRQSELAIRCALGASRAAIVRQVLLESLLLSAVGTLVGLGVAWAGVTGFNHVNAELNPSMQAYRIDQTVLLFTAVVALVVGLLVGLVPAIHILGGNVMSLIHGHSRATSGSRRVRLLSSTLIIAQVAVALMLLVGAGLLVRSFMKAVAVSPGFDPAGVYSGRIAIPLALRADEKTGRGLQERLQQSFREIPAVTAVALSNTMPFQGANSINTVVLAHDVAGAATVQPSAYRIAASASYADTLRLQLVEGRFFQDSDFGPERPPAYVVDENFAKRYLAGRPVIGSHFAFGAVPQKETDWPTIVGVVRAVPHNGIEDRSGIPFVYEYMPPRPGGLSLLVRTTRSDPGLLGQIREKLRAIDPAIALYQTGPMTEVVERSFFGRRAIMMQLGAFAALALFLSALGVYGVLAYDVTQRTHEIGIRGAIGASRSQVIALILRQGVWKAGLGVALGLVGAFLLSDYVKTLLYGVERTDLVSYAAVAAILLAVAALASYLPARRAAKIDPIIALRQE